MSFRRSVGALLLLAMGCHREGAARREGPAPVEVGVVSVATASVPLTRELPGRTTAYRVAEVRGRVNGIVLKRLFREGSDVRVGQVLFQIDPAPYQAALAAARAQLARAEANLASARLQAERYGHLAAQTVSQQEYDNAVAAERAYRADVEAGRAAVDLATIQLGYTAVTSPLTGRIGRAVVTEGAYVQQSPATLLATVQQLDPIYVDLTQPAVDLLRLRRELEAGRVQAASGVRIPVTVVLEDGSEYPTPGTLEFSDVTVDAATGSISVRAIVPNPRGELLPGMFVRARLAQGTRPNALLVPQACVTRDPRGNATALVVNGSNKVEQRRLAAEQVQGDSWIVTDGLAPGDRVIVDNLQRVRPGVVVKPVPVSGAAVSAPTGAPRDGAAPGPPPGPAPVRAAGRS